MKAVLVVVVIFNAVLPFSPGRNPLIDHWCGAIGWLLVGSLLYWSLRRRGA